MHRPAREVRTTVTLRALVGVALGCLVISSTSLSRVGFPHMLVLAFLLSNFLVVGSTWIFRNWQRARVLLLLADTVIVALLVVTGARELALVFFLVLLLVALGDRWRIQLGAATALAALHAWVTIDGVSSLQPAALIPVPLFFSVALYYGFHTGCVRGESYGSDRYAIENHQLAVLVEVVRELAGTLEPQEIMTRVVARSSAIVPARRMSVIMTEAGGETARVLASSDDPAFEPLTIQLKDYPEIQEAVRCGEPVTLENAADHDLFRSVWDRIRGVGFNSFLLVPLAFADETYGTLVLHAASEQDKLAPEQVRFFNTLAAITATTLNNALLHHRLKRSADDLSRIFEHAPDVVITAGEEGRIERANPAAAVSFDTTADRLIGTRLSELYPAFDDPAVREALTAGGPWVERQAVLARRDGTGFEADVTIARMGTGDSGYLLVARDVSEIISSRRALQSADRLRGIGELASAVAHEMNNALTGVMGNAQLVLTLQGLPERAARPLERISANAERCARIVRNLLRFGRERQEQELVSLNTLLDNVLDLYDYRLRSRRIDVVRELDTELPSTSAEPHRIEQVFLILIQNALQAIDDAGGPGTVTVRTFRDGGELVAEIADTGPGIPAELQARIFEPFFTTKPDERHGLGLSVAHGVLEQLGGRVELLPTDAGATFRVCVPLRERTIRSDDDGSRDLLAGLDAALDSRRPDPRRPGS